MRCRFCSWSVSSADPGALPKLRTHVQQAHREAARTIWRRLSEATEESLSRLPQDDRRATRVLLRKGDVPPVATAADDLADVVADVRVVGLRSAPWRTRAR